MNNQQVDSDQLESKIQAEINQLNEQAAIKLEQCNRLQQNTNDTIENQQSSQCQKSDLAIELLIDKYIKKDSKINSDLTEKQPESSLQIKISDKSNQTPPSQDNYFDQLNNNKVSMLTSNEYNEKMIKMKQQQSMDSKKEKKNNTTGKQVSKTMQIQQNQRELEQIQEHPQQKFTSSSINYKENQDNQANDDIIRHGSDSPSDTITAENSSDDDQDNQGKIIGQQLENYDKVILHQSPKQFPPNTKNISNEIPEISQSNQNNQSINTNSNNNSINYNTNIHNNNNNNNHNHNNINISNNTNRINDINSNNNHNKNNKNNNNGLIDNENQNGIYMMQQSESLNNQLDGNCYNTNNHQQLLGRTQISQQQQSVLNPLFAPMLSQKSLQIAEQLESPMERLLNSQLKVQQKLQKIKQEVESDFTFRPKIGKSPSYLTKQRQLEHEYLLNYNSSYYTKQGPNNLTKQEDSKQMDANTQSQELKGYQMIEDDYQIQSNIWDKLYQHGINHKKKLENLNQISKIQSEKQEISEVTFQPNVMKFQLDMRKIQTDRGNADIVDRCYQWATQREQRLQKERDEINQRPDHNCTFRPQISRPKQAAVSENQKHGNLQNCEQITEYEKKGVEQFFQRIDKSYNQKQYINQQYMKCNGQAWKNQVTIPKEFNFMKKPIQTSSASNLKGSQILSGRSPIKNQGKLQNNESSNKRSAEKNLQKSYVSVRSDNENIQQAQANYEQAIQDLHQQLMHMDQ